METFRVISQWNIFLKEFPPFWPHHWAPKQLKTSKFNYYYTPKCLAYFAWPLKASFCARITTLKYLSRFSHIHLDRIGGLFFLRIFPPKLAFLIHGLKVFESDKKLLLLTPTLHFQPNLATACTYWGTQRTFIFHKQRWFRHQNQELDNG